jgi:hypothetical protein
MPAKLTGTATLYTVFKLLRQSVQIPGVFCTVPGNAESVHAWKLTGTATVPVPIYLSYSVKEYRYGTGGIFYSTGNAELQNPYRYMHAKLTGTATLYI